jgi:acetylglutamate kinase
LKLLVKIGGTLLDDESSRRRLSLEVARVSGDGHQVVVVHGGGKQMTRFLNERGVESRFIDGLRVTTPETLDAVLKVLAGSVNKQLVASLIEAGAQAVGLSGVDAGLVEAEPLRPELGAVGRPVRGNRALLELLTLNGYLPVVACVAGDRQGNIYNVNADQMAVACALGYGADQLLFLTDVAGVLDEQKQLLHELTLAQSESLIERGVATGGMLAKLNSAAQALRGGIGQVLIAPGSVPGVIGRLLASEVLGTRMVTGAGAEVKRDA